MKRFSIALLLLWLSACSAGLRPLPVADAGRYTIQPLAPLAADDPVGLSADGGLVAWGDSALYLFEVPTRQLKQLLDASPDALCWSPDGAWLATAIRQEDGSILHVFDRSGGVVHREQLAGRVGRLQWPKAGRLTAAVLEFKTFSFGTHISGQLLQWDVHWDSTKTPLYETTINPALATQLSGRLHQTLDFDLSPLGDEVLYARLYAPPAFDPARYLVLRNLQSADEARIAPLPLLEGRGRLAADGESVLVADGAGEVSLQGLWSSEIHEIWAGRRFDYDAASGLLLVDRQLFQGQAPLVTLPQESRAQIAPGGEYLLVNWQQQLYLLSGYPLSAPQARSTGSLQRLLKLRRLRSRGLIEQHEYLQSRERLSQ